jgi:hypothetical protein
MKKVLSLLVVVCFVAISFGIASAYELFEGPTGVTKYDKEKTYNGYVLLAPYLCKNIYLIDREGNIVHQWNTPYTPGLHAELLPNGNLLVAADITSANPGARKVVYFGGPGGLMRELSWDNKVVWEYTANSPKGVQHHTFDRMPNGNTLVLLWEYKTWKEAIAKGRNPKTTYPDGVVSRYDPKRQKIMGIWPDAVQEVDKNGKVVWEWHVWDHIGKGYNKIDINYTLPEAFGLVYSGPDWTHFNTVQYLPQTDQILLNSRNFGEFYIIDHKTGKIVYRWGNPSAYGKGRAPAGYADDGDQILFGPHHAYMLPNGNISIFDNGTQRPSGDYSRVVEMDPKTGKIVWQYAERKPSVFYAAYQGAAQKLPNGNYLVTSTMQGRIFEVTPDKEVVWDFINPMGSKGPVCTMDDRTRPIMMHKALAYGPDYPGLKGKNLKPKGKLAPGCPDFKKFMEKAVKADEKKK